MATAASYDDDTAAHTDIAPTSVNGSTAANAAPGYGRYAGLPGKLVVLRSACRTAVSASPVSTPGRVYYSAPLKNHKLHHPFIQIYVTIPPFAVPGFILRNILKNISNL